MNASRDPLPLDGLPLEIVTVSTHSGRFFEAFRASALETGHTLVVLGEGLQWKGYGMKLGLLQRHLESLRSSPRLVLFADAHDSLILHGPDRILERYAALGWPLLFSAERYSWPDDWKAAYYPPAEHPWKYLNSGGFLGRSDQILQFLEAHANLISDTYDDQRFWTDIFFADRFVHRKGLVGLDTGSALFQTLCGSLQDLERGRELRNRITGSSPSVLHGNSFTDLSGLIDWRRSLSRAEA